MKHKSSLTNAIQEKRSSEAEIIQNASCSKVNSQQEQPSICIYSVMFMRFAVIKSTLHEHEVIFLNTAGFFKQK